MYSQAIGSHQSNLTGGGRRESVGLLFGKGGSSGDISTRPATPLPPRFPSKQVASGGLGQHMFFVRFRTYGRLAVANILHGDMVQQGGKSASSIISALGNRASTSHPCPRKIGIVLSDCPKDFELPRPKGFHLASTSSRNINESSMGIVDYYTAVKHRASCLTTELNKRVCHDILGETRAPPMTCIVPWDSFSKFDSKVFLPIAHVSYGIEAVRQVAVSTLDFAMEKFQD